MHIYEMDAIWAAITVAGDLRFWLIALLFITIYAAINRRKMTAHTKQALRIIFVAFIITALAAQGIKMVADEQRICTPCPSLNCNPYCPTDDPYAFPSGHSALVFVMFTAGWISLLKNNRQRAKLCWVFIIPILVAASRIILDVHTPVQVAAGAVIGVGVAAVVWYVLTNKNML